LPDHANGHPSIPNADEAFELDDVDSNTNTVGTSSDDERDRLHVAPIIGKRASSPDEAFAWDNVDSNTNTGGLDDIDSNSNTGGTSSDDEHDRLPVTPMRTKRTTSPDQGTELDDLIPKSNANGTSARHGSTYAYDDASHRQAGTKSVRIVEEETELCSLLPNPNADGTLPRSLFS
jgi:hypothetical protein